MLSLFKRILFCRDIRISDEEYNANKTPSPRIKQKTDTFLCLEEFDSLFSVKPRTFSGLNNIGNTLIMSSSYKRKVDRVEDIGVAQFY